VLNYDGLSKKPSVFGYFSGPELAEFNALNLKIEASYHWNPKEQTISSDPCFPHAEVYKSTTIPSTHLKGKALVLNSQEPKTFLRPEPSRSRNGHDEED